MTPDSRGGRGSTGQTGGPRRATDPWERLGTLMALVWLVFLAFPLVELLGSDLPWTRRTTAVAALLAFAAVYAIGWLREEGRSWPQNAWRPDDLRFLAAALVPAFVLLGAAGVDAALVFVPYVVSILTYLLPLWWGPLLGTLLAALPLLTYQLGVSQWGMVVPAGLVLGTGIIARQQMRRGVEHDQIQADLRLSRERERVARDVHDVLGHSLTAVTVKADLAERLVHRDPARAAAELRDIQALTRTALAEIRETVSGLRSASLVAELDAARTALEAAGVRLEVRGDTGDVDPRFRTVMGWAVRESVTNVLRHAGASRCTITLGATTVEVADDGRGRSGRSEGNGLRGLRERVEGAGGRVIVTDGTQGRGTRVRVEMETL